MCIYIFSEHLQAHWLIPGSFYLCLKTHGESRFSKMCILYAAEIPDHAHF